MANLAEDRDGIRHLLARYTYNGDRGRISELAQCFAQVGTLEFPGNSATGPQEIEELLSKGSTARNPALTFVRHHITNPLIDIDGGNGTARSYFTVHTDIGPDHSGTYNDRLKRTNEGWRFSHRQVRIDWQAANSLFRRMVTR